MRGETRTPIALGSRPSRRRSWRRWIGFHPIPDVPAREASWAEWLYFKGTSTEASFYLTLMAGPRAESGKRVAGVRLQLQRGDRVETFGEGLEVDEALLSQAPELDFGVARVRLDGARYVVELDLPELARASKRRVRGTVVFESVAGRAMPPFTIHGARGWQTGYVVPVMSGRLDGELDVDGERVALAGGTAYHDHNWGHWDGVSWRWGHVQNEGLSVVYGRVIPPVDAADPSRMTGFLAAYGPDGPLGYATNVTIEESDERAGQPTRIVVTAASESVDLTMEIDVESALTTSLFGSGDGARRDFFQLRARYRVRGRAGRERLDFDAAGVAETFRGSAPELPSR